MARLVSGKAGKNSLNRSSSILQKKEMIFTIVDLIKSKYSLTNSGKYIIIEAEPAVGVLHITRKSPYFIFGDVHLRGRNNGRYPYKYLEMIENLFGPEDNTIEVCSNDMSFPKAPITTVTVDINPVNHPSIVDDGQVLSKIKSERFNRWRCDPPYNTHTAGKMYGTELPSPFKRIRSRG